MPVYAQKFVSDPGKHDGLYWETATGEPPSPLGPLVADATGQGSVIGAQLALEDYMKANPNSKLKVEIIFADHQNKPDIGANIASGSYPTDAMIILPCSMGTLAAIANGLAQNLIHRAADVCLKEHRPLILCVRETPFNRIHLRNMQLASDAGATIFHAIPTFYNHPQTTQDMARNFVHRVLAHVGLPQPGAYQWQPD